MAKRPALVKQGEITRLIKAVRAGGLEVGRVEVEGGRVSVFPKDAAGVETLSPLDAWRQADGQS